MSQKLPLALEDPFTDEYESSLPKSPNPLGSHPPDPVRCFTPSLAHVPEDDAVNASPQSSRTTGVDVELQQRSGDHASNGNADKVGILPSGSEVKNW